MSDSYERLLANLRNLHAHSASRFNLAEGLREAIEALDTLLAERDGFPSAKREPTIEVAIDSQIVAELQNIGAKLDTLIDIGKLS
jgi:hypothetical protein